MRIHSEVRSYTSKNRIFIHVQTYKRVTLLSGNPLTSIVAVGPAYLHCGSRTSLPPLWQLGPTISNVAVAPVFLHFGSRTCPPPFWQQYHSTSIIVVGPVYLHCGNRTSRIRRKKYIQPDYRKISHHVHVHTCTYEEHKCSERERTAIMFVIVIMIKKNYK